MSQPNSDEHSTPDSTKWSGDEIALMVSSVILITLSAFEALATTTIMPNVVADLGAESWFSVASGAALAAQLLSVVVAGALADTKGPRIVLLTGISLFGVGLTLCALAPHVAVFVAGRIIQGVGGGLVIVPMYVLVGAIATLRHRATFFAAFSLAWVVPSLVGPAIAGVVTLHFGWRPVFGAVPVIGVLAVLPMLPVLRRIPSAGTNTAVRLGMLPVLAIAAGSGLVLLQLAGAWGGLQMLIAAGAGIALVGWSLPRLMPRGTVRLVRGLPSVIATRFFAMGALMGATAFLPLVLQRVHDWGPDKASLAVTIGSVSWALGATTQARVIDPDTRKRLPFYGSVLLAVGMVPVCALIWESVPVWPALVGWFFAGLGIGFVHSTLSEITLGMVDRSKHGKVSSWLQVADSAGAAMELAIVSIALALWGVTWGVAYLPASVVALVVACLSVVSAWRIIPAKAGGAN